jgi:hypothetical protein
VLSFNPWDEYARLQQQADRKTLDPRAWAAEELANTFLDAIAANTLKSSYDAFQGWQKNLSTNRAKKHRRRAVLLEQYRYERPASVASQAHATAVRNEELYRVRRAVGGEEWRLLSDLANGGDYDGLAEATGCTISALKTRVSRCRRRVLMACG